MNSAVLFKKTIKKDTFKYYTLNGKKHKRFDIKCIHCNVSTPHQNKSVCGIGKY